MQIYVVWDSDVFDVIVGWNVCNVVINAVFLLPLKELVMSLNAQCLNEKLTPCSRVCLEQSLSYLRNSPTFEGAWRLITVLTRACYLHLFWARIVWSYAFLPHFSKICVNITSIAGFSKWTVVFAYSYQILYTCLFRCMKEYINKCFRFLWKCSWGFHSTGIWCHATG